MQFPQVRSSFHENWTAFFPQKSVNNHSLFSFLKSRQFWQSKHFKIKSQCKSRASSRLGADSCAISRQEKRGL